MSIQSKKVLFQQTIPAFVNAMKEHFPDLTTHFCNIESEGLKHKAISNETYGKQSMIYIHFENLVIRKAFEQFIKHSKTFSFKVFESYSPNNSTTEIQVSYFKGNKWNE